MVKISWKLVVMYAVAASFVPYFHSAGSTQEETLCYMVTSSGNIVNLNAVCYQHHKSLAKATACQGPFDKDGFPIALAGDLEEFKSTIKKINEREESEIEIDAAFQKLSSQIHFSPKVQRLQQELHLQYKKLQQMDVVDETSNDMYNALISELNSDHCYAQIWQALKQKSLKPN